MEFLSDGYTIVFLILAVVVFLKLRSVLGRRTGQERPPRLDPVPQREARNGSIPSASRVLQLRKVSPCPA